MSSTSDTKPALYVPLRLWFCGYPGGTPAQDTVRDPVLDVVSETVPDPVPDSPLLESQSFPTDFDEVKNRPEKNFGRSFQKAPSP